MLCAVNIPREQEIIAAAITIALLIFTRFQCPPTYVQSKPSDNFALRQGLQTFWSNDHIIYCTIVWGLSIARNLILSGYVTFYRINKCFAQWCFLLMTKCFLGPVEMARWAGLDVRVVTWRPWHSKQVYKTCTHIRRESFPVLERLVDVCCW